MTEHSPAHDSRTSSLEEQVLAPIANPDEMDFSAAEAAARVGLSEETLSRALASYLRSILSGNSRFDRFVNGDRSALSSAEQRGLQVFRGKGNCTACHVGPNFTDERTHNTGIAWRTGSLSDAGAGGGAFKTPTLREVARTAPYMHDGSLASLDAVVDVYERGGHANPHLDPEIRALKVTRDEKRDLVAFLRRALGRGTGRDRDRSSPRTKLVQGHPLAAETARHQSRPSSFAASIARIACAASVGWMPSQKK